LRFTFYNKLRLAEHFSLGTWPSDKFDFEFPQKTASHCRKDRKEQMISKKVNLKQTIEFGSRSNFFHQPRIEKFSKEQKTTTKQICLLINLKKDINSCVWNCFFHFNLHFAYFAKKTGFCKWSFWI
jgi:hypothetical protein